MSAPPPVVSPPARNGRSGLSRRALLLIALAFGIGLLLFLMLWLDQRNDDDFFRAPGAQPDGERSGQVLEPLPVPDGGIPGAGERDPDDDVTADPDQSRGEIEPRFPSPDTAPVFEPVAPAPPPPAPPVAGPSDASARPIRSPAPLYPSSALRRRESGTVLLQVYVDARGRPERVEVVQSSRSSALDREAVRTVEDWDFAPAVRGGQPIAAKVLIPIEFRP